MDTPLAKHLFTVDEYHRMAQAGIFDDDRGELPAGDVVEMTPIGNHLAACVNRLNGLLSQALAREAIIRIQSPVQLDQHSDLSLTWPRSSCARLLRPCPSHSTRRDAYY